MNAAPADPRTALGDVLQRAVDASTFMVERHAIVEAARRLRDGGWRYLLLVTGIDYPDRVEVWYHFVRYGDAAPICVRTRLPREDPRVPSIARVFPAADWHERETYDLLGIAFDGHPDLRRILLPQDYTEFPLRKEVRPGNRS